VHSKRRASSASGASTELARLFLRGALGGTLIAHGLKHGRSIEGTAGWFKSIGFRQPKLQAQLSSVVEVGSGAALIMGAATPLAASAVVGTMAVAAKTVHQQNGYWITAEGWEYVAFISAAAVALSSLGPGRFSVDSVLGIDDKASGPARAALTLALGIGGAAAQLKAFWTAPAGA
jgi:putative oxidoreductase